MITVRAPQSAERSPRARVDERPRPNLRLIEGDTESKRHAPAGLVGTLCIILVFVCIFGVVVFQAFLVQAQARLDTVNRDVVTEEVLARELRLEVANLESPDRIAKEARDRLQMIPPTEVVYIEPGPDDDGKAQFDPNKEKPAAVATTRAPIPVQSTTMSSALVTSSTTLKTTTTTTRATTTTTRATTTTTRATTTTTRATTTTTRATTTTTRATTTTTRTR